MRSGETNVARTSEVRLEIASQRSRFNARVAKFESAISGEPWQTSANHSNTLVFKGLLFIFPTLCLLHRRTEGPAGVEALDTPGQKFQTREGTYISQVGD